MPCRCEEPSGYTYYLQADYPECHDCSAPIMTKRECRCLDFTWTPTKGGIGGIYKCPTCSGLRPAILASDPRHLKLVKSPITELREELELTQRIIKNREYEIEKNDAELSRIYQLLGVENIYSHVARGEDPIGKAIAALMVGTNLLTFEPIARAAELVVKARLMWETNSAKGRGLSDLGRKAIKEFWENQWLSPYPGDGEAQVILFGTGGKEGSKRKQLLEF